MIRQLNGHITDELVDRILSIIKSQYHKYLKLIGSKEFANVFLEEYAPHKRQHGISWAISSAFRSNTVIDGILKVECLRYGKGHTRPSLSNDKIEIHILNKSTDFNANYLMERYKYNSDNFSREKLFAYIKFEVKNNRLKEVSLCLPDEKGNVVREEVLLKREDLRLIAA